MCHQSFCLPAAEHLDVYIPHTNAHLYWRRRRVTQSTTYKKCGNKDSTWQKSRAVICRASSVVVGRLLRFEHQIAYDRLTSFEHSNDEDNNKTSERRQVAICVLLCIDVWTGALCDQAEEDEAHDAVLSLKLYENCGHLFCALILNHNIL